ncbi:MAG: endonuclease III, partial [Bacteroidia bacterium]|nr:endonuclease III [Bacteroidia bacterium]
MTKKERYRFVLDWFGTNMPVAESELSYRNPFELLVAVILSAQCTDKRVNIVTPALFDKFPDALSMSRSNADDIFNYISSVTYPRNKSNHLYNMSLMLVNEFGSQVPSDVSLLQKLPGVGRKTANV